MVYDQESDSPINPHGHDVTVDADGHIYLSGLPLTQRDAIDIAMELVDAVRRSVDRNQIPLPSYYDSRQINARAESPLGVAYTALRRIYRDPR